MIGEDVVSMLNSSLKKVGVTNVNVVAILNDTTGTLVAGSHDFPNTAVGKILYLLRFYCQYLLLMILMSRCLYLTIFHLLYSILFNLSFVERKFVKVRCCFGGCIA